MQFRSRPIAVALAALLTFVVPLNSGGQTLPELGDSSQSVISPAQEKKLGESVMRQV